MFHDASLPVIVHQTSPSEFEEPGQAEDTSVSPEIVKQATALLVIAARTSAPAETTAPLKFLVAARPPLEFAESAEQATPADLAAALDEGRRSAKLPAATAVSITAISFAMTFVGASIALLLGLLPAWASTLALPAGIDVGVVLLSVPLCALVLAMLVEAVRAALAGTPRPYVPRATAALSEWRPGVGDG
jgi:hypothetical protein